MKFLHPILKHFSALNIIFPYYHLISDDKCPHVRNLYSVKKVQQFEIELDFLLKHYQPISLEEVLNHIKQKTKPAKPSFLLSFDDGLSECYHTIAPILIQKGLNAIFFLNQNFIGNKDLFYRYKVSLIIEKLRDSHITNAPSIEELLKLKYADTEKINQIALDLEIDFTEFLKEFQPYMNWTEIKQLQKDGFYFGGHSMDHPYYNEISLDEQLLQTKSSVENVVNELNLDYNIFSFPFTDDGVSTEFFNQIQKEQICDLTFGTAGIKSDEISFHLQRLPMEKFSGSVENYMTKSHLKFLVKKLIAKHRVTHKNN